MRAKVYNFYHHLYVLGCESSAVMREVGPKWFTTDNLIIFAVD